MEGNEVKLRAFIDLNPKLRALVKFTLWQFYPFPQVKSPDRSYRRSERGGEKEDA
jgi:hypothetical protein